MKLGRYLAQRDEIFRKAFLASLRAHGIEAELAEGASWRAVWDAQAEMLFREGPAYTRRLAQVVLPPRAGVA